MSKYIKLFNTHSEYQQYIAQNGVLPNVCHCIEQNEVHYNPYVDPSLEVVDLGLPSGLKWAKCNIGANTETDYGLFFSWGGTTGYADASEKNFGWADYELGDGGSSASNMTKYNSTDGKTVLEPADDAAYQATNGALRMPTETEFDELLHSAYVTNTWVTDYNGSGVNGTLFTSITNGNTLFIPASGYCYDGYLDLRGDEIYVWSSSVYSSDLTDAWYLYLIPGGGIMDNQLTRNWGLSVRGVTL